MEQMLLVPAKEMPAPAIVPVTARPSAAAAARGMGLCLLVGVLCYAGMIKVFIGLIG